ncbi:MAG: membrane protein insertion efficiency factor YidD [Burkholderiaceae bacterium]|nr:membrane protein insertion efficiency factor YidD [Burkholderiaceae bacterium]
MIKSFLLFLIKSYQYLVSPWVGHNCRFIPTCSQYSSEAISRFGAVKGCWMTLIRLLRCQPFGGSGLDEVPQTFVWRCWCKNCRQEEQSPINPIKVEQTNHGK